MCVYSQNKIISFEDYWPYWLKICLILYPFLENSTTHITIKSSYRLHLMTIIIDDLQMSFRFLFSFFPLLTVIEFDDKRETWMHLLFFKARLGRIKKMYKVIRYNQKMYHNILWCFSNHSVLMSFTRLESGLKHWTIFRPFLVQQLNMTSVGQNKQSFLHVQLITSADLSILELYPRNWLVEKQFSAMKVL